MVIKITMKWYHSDIDCWDLFHIFPETLGKSQSRNIKRDFDEGDADNCHDTVLNVVVNTMQDGGDNIDNPVFIPGELY